MENGCAGLAFTPILHTMQRNLPLLYPYLQTAVSDAPDNGRKGVESQLCEVGGGFLHACMLRHAQSGQSLLHVRMHVDSTAVRMCRDLIKRLTR